MTVIDMAPAVQHENLGEIERLFDRLWPLPRSITGQGLRQTHDILSEFVPLRHIEMRSGTQVFDWTVPMEWVVRKAYLVAPDGRHMLDFAENNLRLVGYSTPFRGGLLREKLEPHLHSRPDLPDAVPYVTSYYAPHWGFCLSERERRALPQGKYQVVVDTEFKEGTVTLSEAVLTGSEPDEVLISTYTCHPSLANNELSGPIAAVFLYRRLAAWPKRRLTYRFVFAPETIGALCHLAIRGEHLRQRLVAGYVVTCVGLPTRFTYKRSRAGDTLADLAAVHALRHFGVAYELRDFAPMGSNERQYCSPGFNLPVGSLMRGVYGEYPEYHTSLDNKALISFEALQGSIDVYETMCRALDQNLTYRNLLPFGEPQLGKRSLYPTLSTVDQNKYVGPMMWLLNLSDGRHDLLTIAERSGVPIELLWQAARAAEEKGILERCRFERE